MNNNCTILITTRNRQAILAESLSRLKAIGLHAFPLLVYDDNSDDSDANRKVVEAWPGGRIIFGDKWMGQSHGRNVLMKLCNSEFALVLDDDQYFLELGDLESHLLRQSGRSGAAIVTFARISKSTGRRDIPAWVAACGLGVFTGGTALFHVPSVLSVGGFRDYWGFGYEEPELSMRLYAAGYSIWYDPSIVMEHNQFDAPEESRDTELYDLLYSRNAILVSTLNMPLWLGLPDGLLRSMRRLLHGRRNCHAKLRGTLQGINDTFKFWKDRRPLSYSMCMKWRCFQRSRDRLLNSKPKQATVNSEQ